MPSGRACQATEDAHALAAALRGLPLQGSYEGTLRPHMEYAGQRHDSLVCGLLAGGLR